MQWLFLYIKSIVRNNPSMIKDSSENKFSESMAFQFKNQSETLINE